MGTYRIEKQHLIDIIENYSKDKHLLCSSFLDGKLKPPVIYKICIARIYYLASCYSFGIS